MIEFMAESLAEGTVHTVSGSIYQFYTGGGKWWVEGHNVSSAISQPLGQKLWRIKKPVPWPPIIGKSLDFESVYPKTTNNPDRMPGGGKTTSLIRSFLSIVK